MGHPGGASGGLTGVGSGLPDWVVDRRAVESLRSGVPNRDAVRALGCAQPAIEDRFRRQLEAVAEAFPRGEQVEGLLVAGDFGSGKSHLLEYLQQIALAERFVVSKVVISKETPLHDPVKLYRAAVRAAVVPGRVGAALALITGELRFDSPAYLDFFKWVQSPTAALNQRFAATTYLYEVARQEGELLDRIISFWAGDPIQVGELKRALKAAEEDEEYAPFYGTEEGDVRRSSNF